MSWMSPSSRVVSTRAKAEVFIVKVEGEPLELSYVGEGKGQASPSSRAVSARAKVEVVTAEVEGEPLEPSYVGEGGG